jgi:hypothetical protein
MSKFAAAITIPVTNANMQENSTRSITSLVICTLPDCAVARASPLQATPEIWPNGDGYRPNFGNTRCICGRMSRRCNSASGKSEDVLILQANRRACAPRETAARLERELVGLAWRPLRVGRSFDNVFASLNPSRAALSTDSAGSSAAIGRHGARQFLRPRYHIGS